MRRRLKHIVWLTCCAVVLLGLFAVGANAYDYPTMPSDWQNLKVMVGDVTMPFERYPDGAYWDPEKSTMTVEEKQDYGLSGGTLNLQGWQCTAFARYAYAALFNKYPQSSTMDTSLAYEYSRSIFYVNMIEKVLGTRTLAAGYDAATLKKLFTACQPGAVLRINGHSMVLMAIFDDGVIIYDANFSNNNAVGVRKYTYSSFVTSLGYRGIEALHMPAYYPGYTYSSGGGSDGYKIDMSVAGSYEVYGCTELNVRERPDVYSNRVGAIKSGTIVEVLGSYNGWAKLTYGNMQRWVSMEYLREASSEVNVTFDASGGVASKLSAVYKTGSSFGTMPTANKSRRTLRGWFEGNTEYTATSKVPAVETLLLKAKWCVLEYQDVLEDAWFSDYVEKAYDQGLISMDTRFNPDQVAPRCQMVTVLGREYERETGETLTNTNSSFTDVSAVSYYAPYVAWGAEIGIIKGMGDNVFQPDINVSREQIAVFLYRYAIYRGNAEENAVDMSNLQKFSDASRVSDYAKEAVSWAVAAEILQGDDVNRINPQGYAKRSEMITMFSRYVTYCENHPAQPKSVTITFDAAGGTATAVSLSAVPGKALGQIPTATRDGYTFAGWFLDNTEYTAESIAPKEDITLKACWSVRGYTDVPEGHWVAEYLAKCYDYGMLEAETTFDPERATNRAEVVMMLGRGYETQTGLKIEQIEMNFTDVSLDQPYSPYVAWAAANGIAMGMTDTTFGPEQSVTRAQLCLFLYRMACFTGFTSEETPVDTSVLAQFSDGSSVTETFQKAISWAVSNKIINGVDGAIQPYVPANRAQVITVIARYLDLVN